MQKKLTTNEIIFLATMLMNSLEVRRCLVEMHAVLGEDLSFRSKEDLLELDRDHFPSDLGHFLAIYMLSHDRPVSICELEKGIA